RPSALVRRTERRPSTLVWGTERPAAVLWRLLRFRRRVAPSAVLWRLVRPSAVVWWVERSPAVIWWVQRRGARSAARHVQRPRARPFAGLSHRHGGPASARLWHVRSRLRPPALLWRPQRSSAVLWRAERRPAALVWRAE